MNTQILFGKLHSWNTAVSKSMIFCLLLLRIWKLVQYCICMAYCASWNQRTIQNRWVVACNSFRLVVVFNPPESKGNPKNNSHFEHNCCLVWYGDNICQCSVCKILDYCVSLLDETDRCNFSSLCCWMDMLFSIFLCSIFLCIFICHLVFFHNYWQCATESYIYRQKKSGSFLMLHL